MEDNKNEISFDLYYLNRGIWLRKDIEINVLSPLLIFIVFQNQISFLISFLLVLVLVSLNKNGFSRISQLTNILSFYIKKEILPIDKYDDIYYKKIDWLKNKRENIDVIFLEELEIEKKKKKKKKK